MRAEAQTDFTGGMCDAGRGRPANGYALGVNVDIDRSGRMVRRPLARFIAGVEGTEILHAAMIESALLGDLHLLIVRRAGRIYVGGWNSAFKQALGTMFVTLPNEVGPLYIQEEYPGEPPGVLEHASALQIGQNLFVFFKFLREFRVYSGAIDGFVYVQGTPVMSLIQRSYAVPASRAAVYAFSRVWLAARLTEGACYMHVAASDRVDGDATAPDLVFNNPMLAVDDNSSGDILGFSVLGTTLLVFKRFSVWQIQGANGEPGGMRVRMLTDQAGPVGPGAFLSSGGRGYFVSNGGLSCVEANGRVKTLTGPFAETYRTRVPFTSAEYPLVSLCQHGGRILASVPYDASGEAGQGEEEVGSALLVYSIGLERVIAFWTGAGFGGLLVGSSERGSRSAYVFSDAGRLEIFREWVWSDLGTVHDDLALLIETRDLAPGPGRHFVAGLRLSVANRAAADGEIYPADVTVTCGLASQTKRIAGATATLAFHFCRAGGAIAFRIEATGGMLVIEAATVTYVPGQTFGADLATSQRLVRPPTVKTPTGHLTEE
jgi:hypothetical protein